MTRFKYADAAASPLTIRKRFPSGVTLNCTLNGQLNRCCGAAALSDGVVDIADLAHPGAQRHRACDFRLWDYRLSTHLIPNPKSLIPVGRYALFELVEPVEYNADLISRHRVSALVGIDRSQNAPVRHHVDRSDGVSTREKDCAAREVGGDADGERGPRRDRDPF